MTDPIFSPRLLLERSSKLIYLDPDIKIIVLSFDRTINIEVEKANVAGLKAPKLNLARVHCPTNYGGS